MTPEQYALLIRFSTSGAATIPRTMRRDAGWAKRKGFLRSTGRTSGIANTVGGVQWLHVLTDAGREALAQREDGR